MQFLLLSAMIRHNILEILTQQKALVHVVNLKKSWMSAKPREHPSDKSCMAELISLAFERQVCLLSLAHSRFICGLKWCKQNVKAVSGQCIMLSSSARVIWENQLRNERSKWVLLQWNNKIPRKRSCLLPQSEGTPKPARFKLEEHTSCGISGFERI